MLAFIKDRLRWVIQSPLLLGSPKIFNALRRMRYSPSGILVPLPNDDESVRFKNCTAMGGRRLTVSNLGVTIVEGHLLPRVVFVD